MSKAADDYENIARRLKELEADRQLALTGSTVPEAKVGEAATGWPRAAQSQKPRLGKPRLDGPTQQPQPTSIIAAEPIWPKLNFGPELK